MATREKLLKSALEIELISVGWIMTEAILAAIAAYRAGSLPLSAFSVDSAIELIGGMMLVIRLFVERYGNGEMNAAERIERWTSGTIGACLLGLAAYISLKAGQAFHAEATPSLTMLGLLTAAASSLITPWLAVQKLRYGRLLNSSSLMGDAMCSFTCAYMSWTLLLGLGINTFVHLWWIDALAALSILAFVIREGFEQVEACTTGQTHVHHHSRHL